MSVSNITYSNTAAATSTAQNVNTFTDMQSNQFMQLLLVQLKNQNPLEPMKDGEILSQITTLNSLQELQNISATLESISGKSDLSDAADLIGKEITYKNQSDITMVGIVTAVVQQDGQAKLQVNDTEITLDNVITVREPEEN